MNDAKRNTVEGQIKERKREPVDDESQCTDTAGVKAMA